jgi:hypothetical protein
MFEPSPRPDRPARLPLGGRLAGLVGLGFLVVVAVVLTLIVPWKLSGYQLTQWLVFGEPTLALRALPSSLAAVLVGFPAGEAEIMPLFLASLLALNLVTALVVWLLLRRTDGGTLVLLGLLAFTGVWYVVNAALVPNTDPLMYLPAAVGIVLILLAGPRPWLLPVLWLLAALILYVHAAGLFSAIPVLFAAYFLLRPTWTWRDLGYLAVSIAVVGLVVTAGRSLDPPRPADADFAAVLAAEVATVQARATFPINQTAAINQYRSVGDILEMTLGGDVDFHGVIFEQPRWHFTVPAAAFLVSKLVLVVLVLGWRPLVAALAVWHPWQLLIALGALTAPLPLFLLGTDYHRWLGFVEWNLTIVLLVLLLQAARSGRAPVAAPALLPVVASVVLF